MAQQALREKKRFAASVSRLGLKRNPSVFPSRIHSAIEVHPDLFHFDVRLIDAPRVVGRLEMGPTALLQFGCVALHPAVDRGVIDVQSPLEHHLF